MPVDLTDPFIFCSITIGGSLLLSTVVGTLNACFHKGAKATLCMRVGDYVMAALLWLFGTSDNTISRAFLDSAKNGRFTFWSRVFDSIGGCWVATAFLAFVLLGLWNLCFS